MNRKIQRISIVLLILYIIVSLYLLFASVDLGIKKSTFPFEIDKILHFLMFIPYPVLLWLIIRYGRKEYKKRKFSIYLLIFALSVAIGAATELGQNYLSVKRNGSYSDLLADAAGVAFALLLLWIFEPGIDRLLSKLFADRKKTEQSAGMDK